MTNTTHNPRGSIWRRWDLHIHTKGTMKSDHFKSKTFDDFCTILFKKALWNDIAAIGITDYFNINNYTKVKDFVRSIDSKTDFNDEEIDKIKLIFLIPNVELRMLPVTDRGRLVNIHCIFNPNYVSSLDNNFFGSIAYSAGPGIKHKMNKQGLIDLGKSLDSNLDNENAYKKGVDSFVVTHSALQKLLDENTGLRENVIVAVSNSSNDGASAFQKHYDFFEDNEPGNLEAVRKSIYSISQVIFSGNENDSKYFIGKKTDTIKVVKNKCGSIKPCIHGSDAHTEDKLFSPDKDRFCWIKADLTFEGLKQILYEPEPGERVKISPVKPDQKTDYKVISQIHFSGSNDFPNEIKFNKNLCSIIGSRSSGKSALLAYIAHSVDPGYAEDMIKGPGEGKKYLWSNIDIDYSIEWKNGQSNDESPGKMVYIPQNYLFDKSKDSDEIKNKINPVLFRALPDFEVKYNQAEKNISLLNQQIIDRIDSYFELSDSIVLIDFKLKDLGNKDAIEQEKSTINIKIKNIKNQNKLKERDLEKYQEIDSILSKINTRISDLKIELSQMSEVSKGQGFFSGIKITTSPALANLPAALQSIIQDKLKKNEDSVLNTVNKSVLEYKQSIINEKLSAEKEIIKTKETHKKLIKNYQKNEELRGLVKKITEHNGNLKKIEQNENVKKKTIGKINDCAKIIKSKIFDRSETIKNLKTELEGSDQRSIENIKFIIEYDYDENLRELMNEINIKEKSKFLKRDKSLKIEDIRNNPDKFLSALYKGEQKIITSYDPKEVAIDTLTLTEKILFAAEMEDDKIGGFSDSTMTPGKRALFLLRLILTESNDRWPLLIDQPEDDLDSRSIYDDIVPFLKDKKKERQIIMVSHNANLVVGADTEQVIVANRHGTDRKNVDKKEFNYLTGGLEVSWKKDEDCTDTLNSQGIREHTCDILDGGKTAFLKRKNKYNIK